MFQVSNGEVEATVFDSFTPGPSVYALYINSGNNVNITNNIFSNIDQKGVLVENSQSIDLLDNELTEIPTGLGLTIINSNQVRIIRNNLTNVRDGMGLVDVHHSLIADNYLSNMDYAGISMSTSHFNTLYNNEIYYSGQSSTESALRVSNSNSNNISFNTLDTGNTNGIHFQQNPSLNIIKNNTIRNFGQSGIYGLLGTNNLILYNEIEHNVNGIYIGGSDGNYLLGNTINKNSGRGIDIDKNFIIQFNEITENLLGYYANGAIDIYFQNNTLKDNIAGILIGGEIRIEYNNFFNNSFVGESQGQVTKGPDTIVDSNFWSDWISPDGNNDSIVDLPYWLTGGNADLHPQVVPYNYSYQIINNLIILYQTVTVTMPSYSTTTITDSFMTTQSITLTEKITENDTTTMTEVTTPGLTIFLTFLGIVIVIIRRKRKGAR